MTNFDLQNQNFDLESKIVTHNTKISTNFDTKPKNFDKFRARKQNYVKKIDFFDGVEHLLPAMEGRRRRRRRWGLGQQLFRHVVALIVSPVSLFQSLFLLASFQSFDWQRIAGRRIDPLGVSGVVGLQRFCSSTTSFSFFFFIFFHFFFTYIDSNTCLYDFIIELSAS